MTPAAAPPFHDVPVFGTYDPARIWRDRPCVYGIGHDVRGRLLVVAHGGEILLPGGGIDAGETPTVALAREALEETGYGIVVGPFLAHAREYYDPDDGLPARHKLCHYHRITVGPALGPPLEPDHAPLWLSPEEAAACLARAVDRWAVLRHGSPGGVGSAGVLG